MSRAARLIFALTALLTAVAAGIAVAQPASAVTDGASIDVVIDDITPLIPRENSTLQVTGRIANVSTSEFDQVSVRLRTSIEPLSNRALIDEIAEASLTPNAPYDNRYFDRTRVTFDDALAPGEQQPFTIRIPMRQLRFTSPGTYTVSVEALGRQPASDEFEERKGIQRTFLPWFPDPRQVRPIGVTWLWPLADWPARDADGSFINDRTPLELSSGGRLRELLDIAATSPSTITWIADPELLQAASAISRGYQVLRNGTPIVGDHSADATAWLHTLSRALRDQTLQVLPYSDVDAGSMARAGLTQDVVRSVTTAPAVAAATVASPVTGGMAWAPAGRFDKQTANLLSTAGVRTVILSSAAMPPIGDSASAASGTTPSGVADYGTVTGPINAVLIDQGLARALELPQSTAAEVLAARQRFLAHTALIAAQPDAPDGRIIVAAPAGIRWQADPRLLTPLLRATSSAPWMRAASLADLLNADRTARRRVAYGTDARRAELADRYVAKLIRTQERVDRLAAVLSDPSSVATTFGAALLRAQSSAWRSEPKTADQLLATINAELATRVNSVHALSSGTVTFSGDTGRVPVTISNEGADPVTVGVALIGEPPSRLESTAHPPIEIAPGRKASVDLEARVIGGDPLTVRVQLLTPEGDPFGEPERITLGSTAYARAAAWVVGLAFAAIAVFVVFGVTRRILNARREASAAEASGSDTVSS